MIPATLAFTVGLCIDPWQWRLGIAWRQSRKAFALSLGPVIFGVGWDV